MTDATKPPDDDYPYAATGGTQIVPADWQPPPAGKEPYIDRLLQGYDAPLLYTPSERQIVALVCVGIGLLTCNVLYCPVLDLYSSMRLKMFLGSLGTGVFLAECAALSTALVFGANPLWLRLVVHWAAALFLFGAWVCGFMIADWGVSRDELQILLVSLPMVGLGAQLPLWVARLYFQWRLVSNEQEWADVPPRPLSIGDIMLGTIVVALTAAVARTGPIPAGAGAAEYWLGLTIAMAVTAGISTVFIPRLLVWTLGVKNAGWGTLAILAYATTWSAVWPLLAWTFAVLRNVPWFVVPGTIFGFSTALCGMFLLARCCGYRLEIGRNRPAASDGVPG